MRSKNLIIILLGLSSLLSSVFVDGFIIINDNNSYDVSQHYHSNDLKNRQLHQSNDDIFVLFANDDNNNENSKAKKAKGVYVRPSGAIERGSGFFVPGLEGPKVRVIVGVALLLLTVINHALESGSEETYALEESIAVVYSLLVLFQAAIEFGKEELLIGGGGNIEHDSLSSATTANSNSKDLIQKWSQSTTTSRSEEYMSRVQWSAASYVAVTPATQMLLLEEDTIAYQLGNDMPSASSPGTNIGEAVHAALQQLQQSKGGRIALPLTHPAVEGIFGLNADQQNNNAPRTVVLQRITDDSCWMMSSSDQLLASFTASDLKWLGQLGNYVASSSP